MLGKLRAQVQHLLDPYQFAYKDKRGTADALCTTSHLILKHLENTKAYARLLFIDFSSAFNTIVPHILLQNLRQMQVSTVMIRWYNAFLTTWRHGEGPWLRVFCLSVVFPLYVVTQWTKGTDLLDIFPPVLWLILWVCGGNWRRMEAFALVWLIMSGLATQCLAAGLNNSGLRTYSHFELLGLRNSGISPAPTSC